MSGLRIKINYCFIVFFLLITLISLRTMAKDHCQSCNGSAENNLGIMYRDGLGGEKNEKKARELFEKATSKGNIDALYNLGVMYGDGLGGEKNEKKARELFEKAASKGNIDALYNLGVMYRDGEGGEKNEKKARELFKKATTLN